MPGRQAFLRCSHVAAAAAGEVMIGVIAVWREHLRHGRPAESRARGQVGHRAHASAALKSRAGSSPPCSPAPPALHRRLRPDAPSPRGHGHDGSEPVTKTTQTQRRTTARPAWCQAPPGMSTGHRARRTRLLACPADGRLRHAYLDIGMLTVAVAVGAGHTRRRPRTMTTNQTCRAPDPPLSQVRFGVSPM